MTECSRGQVQRSKRWIDISQERTDVKKGYRGWQRREANWAYSREELPYVRASPICLPEEAPECGDLFRFWDGDTTSFSKCSPSFSSRSLLASLPSHTASSSLSLSGSQAHKSRDQRHGLNLSFLPPVDKGLFVLLQDASLYCSGRHTLWLLAPSTLPCRYGLKSMNTLIYTYLCKTTITVDLLLFFSSFYSSTSSDGKQK